MRKIVLRSFVFMFSLLSVISCDESDSVSKGSLSLSFSAKTASNGRSQVVDAKALLVSIEDANGNVLETKKELSLYTFEGEFLSEPLALPVGNYKLTEFIVLNGKNEVIYVTPLEGSTLAYLVNDPLPIPFQIEKDKVTNIVPEVIEASGHAAADFGYSTFSFDVVETISFLLGVFVYDNATQSLILTSHTVEVKSGIKGLYKGNLGDATNRITIRSYDATYTLIVSKPGFVTYSHEFTLANLKEFENKPLTITLTPANSNGVVSFDGVDDYIDLGNIYDDVSLPVTISAWIYIDNTATGFNPIFTSQDNIPLSNGFWFCSTPSDVFIEYGDGKGQNNSVYRRGASYVSNSNIRGKWIHIAGIMRGATDMEVYFNGVKQSLVFSGSSSFSMSSNHPADVAKIGRWFSNDVIYHFKGMIDEVKIWNRSLNASEISDVMAKKQLQNTTGLIGSWNFDEPSGNVLIDSSPNKFNGELKGSPLRIKMEVNNQ
jgi:hypothetical protein